MSSSTLRFRKAVSDSATPYEYGVNANRGGAALTARPTTQEAEAPMRVKTNHQLRTYSRWYWFKWRIADRWFHPEAITDAWYDQGCPRVLNTTGVSRFDLLRWSIDKWLRECSKAERSRVAY